MIRGKRPYYDRISLGTWKSATAGTAGQRGLARRHHEEHPDSRVAND